MTAAEQIKRAEQRAQAERVSHEQTRAHLARVEARLAQADADHAETKRLLRDLVEALRACVQTDVGCAPWFTVTLEDQADWPKERRAADAFLAAEKAVAE